MHAGKTNRVQWLNKARLLVALALVTSLGIRLDASQPHKPSNKTTPAQGDHTKVQKAIETIIDHDAKKEKSQISKADQNTFIISENELNSYLKYRINSEPQKTIKSMVVRLNEPNFISVTSLVDFNQVKVGSNSPAALLASFLGGDQYVKIDGTLNTARGKGEFQLARAELSGMSIPAPLVNRLIKMFGEKQKPPLDPTKPFDLPHGVQQVEVHKGYVVIKL